MNIEVALIQHMERHEFLEIQSKMMPGREQLEDYGLDEAEIVDIQNMFKSVRREPAPGVLSGQNELERMILEYDCSKLAVGSVEFLGHPEKHAKGTIVARCEADPIVVHPDGSVAMYDHTGPKAFDCARSSEALLASLAAFVEMIRNKERWRGRADQAVEVCVKAAECESSRDFYRMLCVFLR